MVPLLEDVAKVCEEERRVAVGREMTKIHEEFFRGTAEEARAHYISFKELWENADPEFQPLVDEALQKISNLGGGF